MKVITWYEFHRLNAEEADRDAVAEAVLKAKNAHPDAQPFEEAQAFGDPVFSVGPSGMPWNGNRTLTPGWYFIDETGDLCGGPFSTRQLADDAFMRYCLFLDKGPKAVIDTLSDEERMILDGKAQSAIESRIEVDISEYDEHPITADMGPWGPYAPGIFRGIVKDDPKAEAEKKAEQEAKAKEAEGKPKISGDDIMRITRQMAGR